MQLRADKPWEQHHFEWGGCWICGGEIRYTWTSMDCMHRVRFCPSCQAHPLIGPALETVSAYERYDVDEVFGRLARWGRSLLGKDAVTAT